MICLCHKNYEHIEIEGSMKRQNTEERRDEQKRENGSTAVLKGTGFILHLRRSGTFDVTLCRWMVVKVVLLVNGGNRRLKRAFAVKIRSLRANKPCRDRHVNTYNCIPIKAAKAFRVCENSFFISEERCPWKRAKKYNSAHLGNPRRTFSDNRPVTNQCASFFSHK